MKNKILKEKIKSLNLDEKGNVNLSKEDRKAVVE